MLGAGDADLEQMENVAELAEKLQAEAKRRAAAVKAAEIAAANAVPRGPMIPPWLVTRDTFEEKGMVKLEDGNIGIPCGDGWVGVLRPNGTYRFVPIPATIAPRGRPASVAGSRSSASRSTRPASAPNTKLRGRSGLPCYGRTPYLKEESVPRGSSSTTEYEWTGARVIAGKIYVNGVCAEPGNGSRVCV